MTEPRPKSSPGAEARPVTSGQSAGSRVHDHALLQRVADGDETALASLYDRWAGRVHTVAYWILQDADEAEDVVEETFWQVWRTARRYDWRRAAGSTWLAIIARSRALDRLRVRRRAAGRELLLGRFALAESAVVEHADPEAEQERAERHAELTAALNELPAEQRSVLELAFFGGMSHAEIAGQTRLPLGTVKTRIRLAVQKLRMRLKVPRNEGP